MCSATLLRSANLTDPLVPTGLSGDECVGMPIGIRRQFGFRHCRNDLLTQPFHNCAWVVEPGRELLTDSRRIKAVQFVVSMTKHRVHNIRRLGLRRNSDLGKPSSRDQNVIQLLWPRFDQHGKQHGYPIRLGFIGNREDGRRPAVTIGQLRDRLVKVEPSRRKWGAIADCP